MPGAGAVHHIRLDKTQSEEKESALPPIADTRADIDLRRLGP